jgi:hypothetical protein
LKTVGIGALGGAGVGVFGPEMPAAAQSDSSVDKSNVARLVPGCCAYSYDHDLRHGAMTLEDFILKAVDLRLVAVDMTVYYLKSTAPEYLHSLRHFAYKHAIAFSGASCGASMVQADDVKRAEVLSQRSKGHYAWARRPRRCDADRGRMS